MKCLILLLFFTNLIFAQTPATKIFEKHKNIDGIESSIQPIAIVTDSIKNTTYKGTTRLIMADGYDVEEKLFKKIKKDCKRFAKNKNYTLLYEAGESDIDVKFFVSTKKRMFELVMMIRSEDMITFCSLVMDGLTKEMLKEAEPALKSIILYSLQKQASEQLY